MNYYLGADPGYAHGALCILPEDLNDVLFFDIGESLSDLCSFFETWAPTIKCAVIEKVGAMPRQGISSALNFGRGIGWLEALLTNYSIPHEYCVPAKWLEVIPSRPTPEPIDKSLPEKDKTKKRAANKKLSKIHTFNFCKRKFPKAELRTFNKDSNRADALGLAFYCWNKYRSIQETSASSHG